MLVTGAVADKPSRLVAPSDPIVVHGEPPRFVSRGGDKLEAALNRFEVEVAGLRALDAGASTGGFTDCLLARGALSVLAVDVGYGQLHPRLRDDIRVTVLERTNVRSLDPASVGAPFDIVVADLSFVSLTPVVPFLLGDLAAPGAAAILLVKPQFEAGRSEASRGRGVIRDEAVRRRVLGEVSSAVAAAGASIMGVMASPVLGPAGNAEFLLLAKAHQNQGGLSGQGLAAALDGAVAAAPDTAPRAG